MHCTLWACSFAPLSDARIRAASIAMIAITTKSSISVNARLNILTALKLETHIFNPRRRLKRISPDNR
jgi:hypothetical protein